MSKVGIFGGTFDPIHVGHLIASLSILEKRNLDKIIFIPCFISPHKINFQSSSAIHRLNLVKLSINCFPKFDYSDIEIIKKEISYTINTLIELKKKYDALELIIGYDNLIEFENWHKPDEILKLTELIVLNRKAKVEKENRFFKNAVFIETPVIEISSTEIRERVKNNLPIDFFVTEKAKEYIYQNNLYI